MVRELEVLVDLGVDRLDKALDDGNEPQASSKGIRCRESVQLRSSTEGQEFIAKQAWAASLMRKGVLRVLLGHLGVVQRQRPGHSTPRLCRVLVGQCAQREGRLLPAGKLDLESA